MDETLKESLIVLGRIITIFPLLLLVTIYMGKRAIGELPIFDFLIVITLGSIVGADIGDLSINHLYTAIAIVAIGLLQRGVAKLKIMNRTIGRLITFEPTVVVQDGKILNQNLKRIRYSIDNVLQLLREKDIFDISHVQTAIIESDGSMSVIKKPSKKSVTLEDMELPVGRSAIALPVIIEGKINSAGLQFFSLNEGWLKEQLSQRGIKDLKEVFFASVNYDLELHISLKDDTDLLVPRFLH
ncbi:DUF421 domain-containing protein [Tenuibacillus multivorans]|uniref:Uncharacterized membrane protein YcaP, DUF421 family n=1 Tax=Tenuibacillus multivorans TaxID=237069 RepID=A0A1G9WHZ6_9BACI|nr:DUF421 domain-containing protein [Tenuibacillus multivorans]GEL76458.1 DUF421 domain-containing protein [Tenuibacillus multivorans]SDM83685.1 Uncharacterized membrane protein YcaP, DUF421 family [Tenuibacillus multivorans]